MNAEFLKLAVRNMRIDCTQRAIAVQVYADLETRPMAPTTDQGVFLPDRQGRPLMDLGYIIVKPSHWIEGVDMDDEGGVAA